MVLIYYRHPVVTAWLWLLTLIGLLGAAGCVYCAFNATDFISAASEWIAVYACLGIFGIAVSLGCALILKWEKIGVYIFSTAVSGAGIFSWICIRQTYLAIIVPIAIALITVGMLFIQKNKVSVWQLLRKGLDWKHCRHLYSFYSILLLVLLGLFAWAMISYNKSNNSKPKPSQESPQEQVVDTVSQKPDTIIRQDTILPTLKDSCKTPKDSCTKSNRSTLPKKHEKTYIKSRFYTIGAELPNSFNYDHNQLMWIQVNCPIEIVSFVVQANKKGHILIGLYNQYGHCLSKDMLYIPKPYSPITLHPHRFDIHSAGKYYLSIMHSEDDISLLNHKSSFEEYRTYRDENVQILGSASRSNEKDIRTDYYYYYYELKYATLNYDKDKE